LTPPRVVPPLRCRHSGAEWADDMRSNLHTFIARVAVT